ncbi:hypothetical protein RI054_08g45840 [Pseudoscourfieldia marina]
MRAHGHRGYRNEQLEDAQEETVTQCKTLKARREADSFHRSGAHRCVERYLAFETSASAFETKVLALRRLGLKRRLGDEGSSGTPSATSTRRLHRSIESGEYAADAAEHTAADAEQIAAKQSARRLLRLLTHGTSQPSTCANDDARQLDAPTVNARQHDMSTDDVWHCTGRTAPMRTRSVRDARHSRDEYATARDAYG